MDETYIKLKAEQGDFYRTVDKFGDTIDFILSECQYKAAANAFFKPSIDAKGFPRNVAMDKSGENNVTLENINF